MCFNIVSYFALPFGTIRQASQLSPECLFTVSGVEPDILSYILPVIMKVGYSMNLSLRLLYTILKHTVTASGKYQPLPDDQPSSSFYNMFQYDNMSY